MTNDAPDPSEALDSDKLGDEFPPERPVGVDQYGTTTAEARIGEPIDERVDREEPDESAPEPENLTLVAEPTPDVEEDLVAQEAVADPRAVDPDEGDPSERLGEGSIPAEVDAIRETRAP